MRYTFAKLWSAFFFAIVLSVAVFPLALLVQMADSNCASCGTMVFFGLWFMGMAAYQPILWTSKSLSFRRRATIWLAACAMGLVGNFWLEAFAVGFMSSDHPLLALSVGSGANLIGVLVAMAASGMLVRRSAIFAAAPDHDVAHPPSTGAAWVVRSLGDNAGSQVRTLTSATTGAVSASSHPIQTAGKRRRWTIAFSVIAVVAALLAGWLTLALLEGRERARKAAEQASADPYPTLLDVRDGGQLRIPPVATLSLEVLLAEFLENEIGAASKYESPMLCDVKASGGECRIIETSGKVDDIGRNRNQEAYIRMTPMTATAQPVSVEAYFGAPEHQSLQAVRRGQSITVRCMLRYDGSKGRSGLRLFRCGLGPWD